MTLHMFASALMLASCVSIISSEHQVDRRPVIGILAQTSGPETKKYGDSYIYSAYVKFIEQAGGLVIPVKIDQQKEYYEDLFMKLNGVVFPGGDVSLVTSPYAKSAQYFFNMSIEALPKGDIFPILGICWGFQELTALVTRSDLLSSCKGHDISFPLNFKPDVKDSRLFKDLPAELYNGMKNWNVTFNNHVYCMTPKVFNENKKLSEFYRILSTNFDENGLEFISTMEAYKYPFYGTQWHPEKNAYLWSNANVNHSALAVQVTQYMSNFFVNQARKSRHQMTVDDLADSVIFNYQPKFMGSPSFHNIYFFDSGCLGWWLGGNEGMSLLVVVSMGSLLMLMILLMWLLMSIVRQRAGRIRYMLTPQQSIVKQPLVST